MFARSLCRFRLLALGLAGTTLVAASIRDAGASETSLCIQRYGAWAQLRDKTLKPLGDAPTLLGLDSAWCAQSPAHLADLRQKFASIVASCQGLPQRDLPRVGSIFAKTEQSLNRVLPCPAQVADEAAGAWNTSVKSAPAKAEPAKAVDVAQKDQVRVPPVPSSKVVAAKSQTAAAAAREPPVKTAEAAPPARAKSLSQTVAAPSAPVQPAKAVADVGTHGRQQPVAAVPVAECLSVSRSAETTYVIENRTCPTDSLLTAFEVSDGSARRCFTKKIRNQISIASSGSAPFIYYQCIDGAPGCTGESLSGMFPECTAG